MINGKNCTAEVWLLLTLWLWVQQRGFAALVFQFSTPGCSRYVKTVDCGQKCLNRFSIKWYIFPQHNENIIILPWSASETSYLLCCSQGSQGSQGSAAVNKTINSVTSVWIAGDLPGPGHRADTSSRLGKDVFYVIIFYRSIYTKIYRVVLDNAKTR